MTYSESIPKNITTNATSKPTQPQIVIENTSDKEIYCNLIEILPNVDFAQNGILVIEIDDIPVLDNKNDSFRSYSKYPLPIGKKIQGRGEVRIFAWNKNNSDQIQCDFNIHLGSVLESIPSVAIPITVDEKNLALSDFETIFPLSTRTPASYTQLINMKGYKKLAVLLSSVVYVDSTSPTVLSGGNFGEGQNAVVDGDVVSYVQLNIPNSQNGQVKKCEVDFRTIAQRDLKYLGTVRAMSANGINVTVSIVAYHKQNLGDSWTQFATHNITLQDGGLSVVLLTQDFEATITTTFRYVKLEFSRGGNNGDVEIRLKEVYDTALVGGTGSLSFEILNSANQWVAYIPSTEFGTVVQGNQALSKILGDTIKSVSGQEYPLPSTQSKFRAKYTVANGGIKNAIDIVRVS